ncbi:uncharacterized protein BYT42DRAFT_506008 [Radiomyces spectabilis]|uniref:uncharacterized protein n=1 Tax=Radiomyces spectabilis TaxID=64574 RepID=UPI00221EBEF1|nr:uncharacterized protein BYT42DRAFT_506008 [Radiomyces spectabilis]KAI8364697.1 hypothetical protein BYT42DRAFT_506008 [Radiomyces spectabilis]
MGDLDVSAMMNPSLWPLDANNALGQPSASQLMQPLDFNQWSPTNLSADTTPQASTLLSMMTQPQDFLSNMPSNYTLSSMAGQLPPTPPVSSPGRSLAELQAMGTFPMDFRPPTEASPPPSSSNSSNVTSPCYFSQNAKQTQGPARLNKQQRSSAEHYRSRPHTYRRRTSSHPSVASIVSLSAHEPVARVIDGIEYITFLYSHDRIAKEYTVRTDIDSVALEDIPMEFRLQNAIYPRANVDREDYDGNRWDYETTCNKLGWILCWLNKEQLFGRRGLIQRAVDSYRNRHSEMRSRRVTRQEKVANGTLRKRRAKKGLHRKD